MKNKYTSFFYGLNIATIGLLLVVIIVSILPLASGTITSPEDKSSYQSHKPSPQELLHQKADQERAASELGFSSRHRIESVYPTGWETPKSTDPYQKINLEEKGFFSTDKKGTENISFLFGLITIILTVFTISALSVPFVSLVEEKQGAN